MNAYLTFAPLRAALLGSVALAEARGDYRGAMRLRAEIRDVSSAPQPVMPAMPRCTARVQHPFPRPVAPVRKP